MHKNLFREFVSSFVLWAQNSPLFVTSLFFGLYAMTLSRSYSGDSIAFAMTVESGNLRSLLETHQILIHPLAWGFYSIWRLAQWQQGSLLPLQLLNALAGACSIGLVFMICKRLGQSARFSLIISIGCGVSAGVWLFSIEAEFVTVPLAISLVPLHALFSDQEGTFQRGWFAVLMGVLVGLAILTYLTSVFLIPVSIVGFLLAGKIEPRVRLRQSLIFLLVVGLLVAPVYSLVLHIHGVELLSDLGNWKVYQGGDRLYGPRLELKTLLNGGYAFLRSFATYPGLGLNSRTSHFLSSASSLQVGLFVLLQLCVFLVGIAAIVVSPTQWRLLIRTRIRELVMLAGWALAYAAFALYWVPGDLQFWAPVTVSIWLLAAILLGESGTRTTSEVTAAIERSSGPRVRFYRATACVVFVLLLVNGLGTVMPQRSLERNLPYQVSQSILERTGEEDLIITSGGDASSQYIPYFTKRQTISVLPLLLHTSRSKEDVFALIEMNARAVWREGQGRVFLVGIEPGNEVWWDIIEDVLTKKDFQRFNCRTAWQVQGETILEVIP